MSKYTPGPLTVGIRPEWPFYIETYNQDGDLVFRQGMPMYSTKQKTAAQAMSGSHMGKHADAAVEANSRALADEVLRASAPELLEAAMAAIADVMSIDNDHCLAPEVGRKLRAAIAKATGT